MIHKKGDINEVRFNKKAPWCCPSYKNYYIQARYIGRDIYGNETYEYALFRKLPFILIRHFRTRKQAYEYLSNLTGYTRWDIKMGNQNIVNDYDFLGIVYGSTIYRIEKRTRELYSRPIDDERLTCWHTKYVDCLSEAKQIIQSREGNRNEKDQGKATRL